MTAAATSGGEHGTVLVGIGAEGAPAAVLFAIDEALSQAWGLHLVRVLPVPPIDLPALTGAARPAVESARASLDAASRRARRGLEHAGLPLTSEVVEGGWVVANLVLRAAQVELVVLERRHPGSLHRIVSGSTVQGVAAHSPSPVVVVPQGWRPQGRAHSVVLCAVQDVDEAGALVRVACVEAERRGGRVDVLHTWDLGVHDMDTDLHHELGARAHDRLDPVARELETAFPTVAIVVRVERGRAAEAVVRAAADADLLVIGRRHHLLPLGTHLGPVARAVLDHSPCPVLVAPEPRTAGPG